MEFESNHFRHRGSLLAYLRALSASGYSRGNTCQRESPYSSQNGERPGWCQKIVRKSSLTEIRDQWGSPGLHIQHEHRAQTCVAAPLHDWVDLAASPFNPWPNEAAGKGVC